MPSRDPIDAVIEEATAAIKSDVRGAIAALTTAYERALATSVVDAARVAEELSRAWSRRKVWSKSLYFASKAAELAPERKAAWTTLGKISELVATRTPTPAKARRARALFRATASAFKTAASMTKDPEDKRWLLELAGDASRQAKSLVAP